MLVFIDESGDPGMKIGGGGSSPYFAVTLVVIEDHEDAAKIEQSIVSLRERLRLNPGFEFHFNKLCHEWREQFLVSVAAHEWFYFTTVFNKASLTGKGFQYPDSFYKYACGLVFQNAKPYLRNATVIIDGSGERKFRNQLSTYLRKRVNDGGESERFIGKVKLQDSHRNLLLQLADMVCGAVARDFSKPEENGRFRKHISHREIQVQFWPK